MVFRWGAFSLLVLGTVALAWGIADWIDVADCTAGRRYCDTASGKRPHDGRNMLLVVGGLLAVCAGTVQADRLQDWRPMLGLSVGAAVGSVVALSVGRESGVGILVAVLLAVGAAAPIGMRRWTAA